MEYLPTRVIKHEEDSDHDNKDNPYGPFGEAYGNPLLVQRPVDGMSEADGNYLPAGETTPRYKYTDPPDYMWVMFNCNEYLKLEEQKVKLDHADDYHLKLSEIKKLQATILQRILQRRDHITADPLYQFLHHVAGTLGNTRVEELYETDETSQTERVKMLLNLLQPRQPNATPNEDVHRNMRKHARAELDHAAPVSVNSATLLGMLRDVNISGRLQMKPSVFQATQRLMTELSQKRDCKALSQMEFMALLEMFQNDARGVTIMGEITAYYIMAGHQLNPRRDYKVIDYDRILRSLDQAWTRLVLLLREKGFVQKSRRQFGFTALQGF